MGTARGANPLWRRIRSNRRALIGFAALFVICVVAVAGPALAPANPDVQDLSASLLPPFTRVARPGIVHVLGTDALGRDIASRVVVGTRVSMFIGFSTVVIAGVAGTTAGLLAGYYGGVVDTVIMRVVDVQLSFPVLLLAIVVAAVLGGSLVNLIAVLVIVSWVMYARIARSEVLAVRELEFVEAVHASGGSRARVLWLHILPNIRSSVVVVGTLEMARVILSEAALSFLGLGVPVSIPSWGAMLADGRSYLSTAWWLATFPGLAIMVTVLSVNLVGDGLRDVLDPRSRT